MNDKLVLGIDTSNYKTSVALVSEHEIVEDMRKFLYVKEGERGLRQSEALFQHINNLPEIFEEIGGRYKSNICAVACSGSPRTVEGSYMPCFLAGTGFARSMGSLLGIPVFQFSHQEGHIEAVRYGSGFDSERSFLACHFSGGTCEVLKVNQSDNRRNKFFDIEIIGGTKDISFGQILDRAGVKMGFSFPCGEKLDTIALETQESSHVLTPVKVNGRQINLSGIETQILKNCNITDKDMLIREIFDRITDAIIIMLKQSYEATGINDIIMSGGVSSSRYIRQSLTDKTDKLNIIFDNNNLSSDNAVGTAFLGRRALWD